MAVTVVIMNAVSHMALRLPITEVHTAQISVSMMLKNGKF